MNPLDLLGVREIAAMLKVGERTARTYVARDDFPAPDAKLSNRRFWKRATVKRWAKKTLPLKFDPRSKQA